MLRRLWLAVKQRLSHLVGLYLALVASANMKQKDYEARRIDPEDNSASVEFITSVIDSKRHRFPHCLVWTPIPCLTWLFPFIGHMGITTSTGVVRDFAGSYYVSEDDMAFGWPTRYLQLDLHRVTLTGSGVSPADFGDDPNAAKKAAALVWDRAVLDASEIYKRHEHNLILDNCHSHCALALQKMRYGNSSRWNMVRLAAWMFCAGSHVDLLSVIKTWLPFVLLAGIVITVCIISFSL